MFIHKFQNGKFKNIKPGFKLALFWSFLDFECGAKRLKWPKLVTKIFGIKLDFVYMYVCIARKRIIQK